MADKRILLIEDDEDIQELVRYNLEKNGYRVSCVISGETGLKKARTDRPDLIILDVMLPGIDGLTVCRQLRAGDETKAIPIAMLTARGEEADVVSGLETGADDYITKPFSPRVLLARIKALLRRNENDESAAAIIKRGDLEIDTSRHEVRVMGTQVELTSTEFKLLCFLAKRPSFVFSRYQIVDAVHGSDYPVTDRSVDVQMVGLRKKLGPAGECIETVRGTGYRFRDKTTERRTGKE